MTSSIITSKPTRQRSLHNSYLQQNSFAFGGRPDLSFATSAERAAIESSYDSAQKNSMRQRPSMQRSGAYYELFTLTTKQNGVWVKKCFKTGYMSLSKCFKCGSEKSGGGGGYFWPEVAAVQLHEPIANTLYPWDRAITCRQSHSLRITVMKVEII
jgi:hypothetical protein